MPGWLLVGRCWACSGGGGKLTISAAALRKHVISCAWWPDASPLHAGPPRRFLQAAGTVKNMVRPDVQMLRQQELEAQASGVLRGLGSCCSTPCARVEAFRGNSAMWSG